MLFFQPHNVGSLPQVLTFICLLINNPQSQQFPVTVSISSIEYRATKYLRKTIVNLKTKLLYVSTLLISIKSASWKVRKISGEEIWPLIKKQRLIKLLLFYCLLLCNFQTTQSTISSISRDRARNIRAVLFAIEPLNLIWRGIRGRFWPFLPLDRTLSVIINLSTDCCEKECSDWCFNSVPQNTGNKFITTKLENVRLNKQVRIANWRCSLGPLR